MFKFSNASKSQGSWRIGNSFENMQTYLHTHMHTHLCILHNCMSCFALFCIVFFLLFTFEKHSPNGCYARPQPYAECSNEGGMEDGTYYSYKQKQPVRKWTKQKENENTKQNKTLQASKRAKRQTTSRPKDQLGHCI